MSRNLTLQSALTPLRVTKSGNIPWIYGQGAQYAVRNPRYLVLTLSRSE